MWAGQYLGFSNMQWILENPLCGASLKAKRTGPGPGTRAILQVPHRPLLRRPGTWHIQGALVTSSWSCNPRGGERTCKASKFSAIPPLMNGCIWLILQLKSFGETKSWKGTSVYKCAFHVWQEGGDVKGFASTRELLIWSVLPKRKKTGLG